MAKGVRLRFTGETEVAAGKHLIYDDLISNNGYNMAV